MGVPAPPANIPIPPPPTPGMIPPPPPLSILTQPIVKAAPKEEEVDQDAKPVAPKADISDQRSKIQHIS